MRAFGAEPEECNRHPFVSYGAAAQTKAQQLLQEANIGAEDPVFIVCPGSVWPTKRWTTAGYAELIDQLTQRYGKVLICGGPDDAFVAQAVHKQSAEKGVNLVGRADLQTFMALIDRARVVISNDSAPMHVAVARNVPVVAIFCATTPSLGYGPYSDQAVVVEKRDLFCRPCSRHGTVTCPRGTEECMHLITVYDVIMGVDQLLARTERSTSAAPIMAPARSV
jgi:heptosyltransferase-2